jgi:serine/threonine protein kinase/predicted ATPase
VRRALRKKLTDLEKTHNRNMKSCSKCGAVYPDEYNVCPQDGATLVSRTPATTSRILDGKYQLVRIIGRGGMGAVYEAIHTTMQRRVAVKILNADLVSNAAALERFRREALLSGRLKHPNAITIYDYGMSAIGEAYIVMEFLEGRSLSQEFQRTKILSPLRVASILAPVCDAVHAAHAEGIIHRDLKPANIMIEKLRAGETVKVLDFGIAKLAMSGPNLMNLTGTGIIGTPQYMSPEQCQGHKVDGRTDVYAIGIIAYEMLTGQLPFNEATPLATVVAQVKHAPPRLCELRPEIPPALEAIVLRALEKSPAKRQQTASELAEGFRSIIYALSPGRLVSLPTPNQIIALSEEALSAAEPAAQRSDGDGPSGALTNALTRVESVTTSPTSGLGEGAERRAQDSVSVPTGFGDGEFVGRTPELGALLSAWHSAGTRRGRPIVIFGESGIGKTRLLEQFLVRLEDIEPSPPLFLRAKCVERKKRFPCQALIEAVRPVTLAHFNPDLQAVRSFTPEEEQFLGGEFLGLLRLEDYDRAIAARCRAANDGRKFLFENLARACVLLARRYGAVLFLDDAQDADATTLEFVTYLSRLVTSHRLLTAIASRPLSVAPEVAAPLRDWLLTLEGAGGFDHVKLWPLSNGEIRLMIEGMLGGRVHLPVAVTFLLTEETKGNPYFIREIVHLMIANRQIAYSDDSGWICQDADEFDLPDSIVSLARPTLDRVAEAAAEALAQAAVIGEEFTFAELQAATERSEEELLKAVESGLKIGILREVAARRDDCYVFTQSLLHRVLYRRLPRRRRKRLHARVVEYLEASGTAPGQPAARGGALAYHCFRAEEWERTVQYGLEAGYERWSAYAYADAGKYFGWVACALERLAHADPPPLSAEARAQYHLTYGALLAECAQVEDAERELQRALALCQEQNLPWLGRVQATLGRLCNLSGFSEEAVEYGEAGLDRLREGDDVSGVCGALLCIAEARLLQGRHAPALEKIEEAFRIADAAGDRAAQATAEVGKAIVAYQTGKYAVALAEARHALALAHSLGSVFEERRALNALSDTHLRMGRLDSAQECCMASLRISYALGHRHGEAAALNRLAHALERKGGYGEALEYVQQALSIARATGNNMIEARYLFGVGRLRRLMGDAKSAVGILSNALLLSQTTEMRRLEAGVRYELGEAHLALKRRDEGEPFFLEAIALARNANAPETLWRALYGVARCRAESDDARAALRALDESVAVIEALQRELPEEMPVGQFRADKHGVFSLKSRLEAERESSLTESRAPEDDQTALDDGEPEAVFKAEVREAEAGDAPPPKSPVMPMDGDLALALSPGTDRGAASGAALESSWRQMLQAAHSTGDRDIERKGLTLMASALHSQGETARARDGYQKVIQILRETDKRDGEGAVLNNIGDTFRQEGRYADALAYYRLALRSAREFNNLRVIEIALVNAGQMYARTGQLKEALVMLLEAQSLNELTGDAQLRAESRQALGEAHLIRKDYAAARAAAEAALEAMRASGSAEVEWRARWITARCHWAQENAAEALHAAELALTALDKVVREINPIEEKRLVRERNDIQAVVEEWRRAMEGSTG